MAEPFTQATHAEQTVVYPMAEHEVALGLLSITHHMKYTFAESGIPTRV